MAEKKYYKAIKDAFEQKFRPKIDNVHLEITSEGKFSSQLKSEIPRDREIIFWFLKGKGQSPDITGYVKKFYSTEFIIIEVKENLKLDDIYQTMKYRDLFNAKYTFLVTLNPIPEEIKRLCRVTHHILHTGNIYQFFVITYFDKKTNDFIEWFEENPFEVDLYWG